MKTDALVIIPARGGSKGIPGKNIKILGDKPLIHYSIEIARKLFPDENIHISTDDEEIRRVAERTGLAVPFLRPADLATDTSSTQDVILYTLEYYKKKFNREFGSIILLQPTSPFRETNHIKKAMALYDENSDIDMVVSVKETQANPYYTLFENTANGFIQKSKTANFTRRQDCPAIYELNGSIYVINPESLKVKSISEFDKVKALVMSTKFSIDIDSEFDWKIAELLLSQHLI